MARKQCMPRLLFIPRAEKFVDNWKHFWTKLWKTNLCKLKLNQFSFSLDFEKQPILLVWQKCQSIANNNLKNASTIDWSEIVTSELLKNLVNLRDYWRVWRADSISENSIKQWSLQIISSEPHSCTTKWHNFLKWRAEPMMWTPRLT